MGTIPALGGSAKDLDKPFIQLLKSLSPGAPFLLRLGGVSGDDSWWPIHGIHEPYIQKLTPQWATNVKAVLTALHGQAIMGVTLKLAPKLNGRIAKAEVANFYRYIGRSRIDAFELGNEPENYPLSVVNGGSGHDTIPAYGKKFTEVAAQLGKAPLVGPDDTGGPLWLDRLGTILSHLPSRLKYVTVHAYALKPCYVGAHPTMADLFTQRSIGGLAARIHTAVEVAAARHKQLRIDEINGISCAGRAGLSNSFGEALWALNILPALWQAGVQGVNFQTIDGNLNQMITAKHSASGWRISVEPEYYGLLAFARAAPAGSHLLQISDPGLPRLLPVRGARTRRLRASGADQYRFERAQRLGRRQRHTRIRFAHAVECRLARCHQRYNPRRPKPVRAHWPAERYP